MPRRGAQRGPVVDARLQVTIGLAPRLVGQPAEIGDRDERKDDPHRGQRGGPHAWAHLALVVAIAPEQGQRRDHQAEQADDEDGADAVGEGREQREHDGRERGEEMRPALGRPVAGPAQVPARQGERQAGVEVEVGARVVAIDERAVGLRRTGDLETEDRPGGWLVEITPDREKRGRGDGDPGEGHEHATAQSGGAQGAEERPRAAEDHQQPPAVHRARIDAVGAQRGAEAGGEPGQMRLGNDPPEEVAFDHRPIGVGGLERDVGGEGEPRPERDRAAQPRPGVRGRGRLAQESEGEELADPRGHGEGQGLEPRVVGEGERRGHERQQPGLIAAAQGLGGAKGGDDRPADPAHGRDQLEAAATPRADQRGDAETAGRGDHPKHHPTPPPRGEDEHQHSNRPDRPFAGSRDGARDGGGGRHGRGLRPDRPGRYRGSGAGRGSAPSRARSPVAPRSGKDGPP